MKWIAWGWHMVAGEKVPHQLGTIECESLAATALRVARLRYSAGAVDHVQSVVSYEVERFEVEATNKNVRWRARKKRPPRKAPRHDN